VPVTETMATKLPSNYCYCFRSHERRNRIRRPLNLCNRASEIIIDVGADRLAGWLAQKPHPAKRGSLALTWPRECIRGGPRAHRAVAIAARSIIACATLAAQRAPPPSARAQFECRPRAGQLAVARPSAGRPASLVGPQAAAAAAAAAATGSAATGASASINVRPPTGNLCRCSMGRTSATLANPEAAGQRGNISICSAGLLSRVHQLARSPLMRTKLAPRP